MPPNEVALFRGYANVVNVAGRSLGAPVGGFLITTLGWRWLVLVKPLNCNVITLTRSRSFLGQLPLIIICMMVAYYGLPSSLNQSKTNDDQDLPQSPASHIDYGGIISFATAIVMLFFFF